MSQPQKEIAVIVGKASNTDIFFTCPTDVYPVKWEYVTFAIPELGPDGARAKVDVLAQVTGVYTVSEIMTNMTSVEAARKIMQANLANVKTWGEARILGYKHPKTNKVVMPRKTAVPGSPIFLASDDFLKKYFEFPKQKALHVGQLITREGIGVTLNIEGLNRHLAILAQTGAGKSYTTGVIIEELLEKGASVVVIDPHSDYVYLAQVLDGCSLNFTKRIIVYKNPESTHRYKEDQIKTIKDFQIKFSEVDPEEVFEIAHVPATATRIKEVFYTSLDTLRADTAKKDTYSPADLEGEIEKIIQDPTAKAKDKVPAYDSRKYLRGLKRSKIFGAANVPIEDFLKPASVSVLDLSGLDDKTMDLVASLVISKIYAKVKENTAPYPIFLVIEESHKFVPKDGNTLSAGTINTIAAEGRKFGMFLTLITQRPSKIHPDALSQCNSQIIMKITNPLDQKAIENSSERMSHELIQDLPGLNPGEAVIVGTVTQIPVMVTIRGRKTREGGSDLDILKLLKQALDAVESEAKKGELQGKLQAPEGGSFSDV